jgi:hypothetical protein
MERRYRGTFSILTTFAVVCPLATVFVNLGLLAIADLGMQGISWEEFRGVIFFHLLYGIPLGYVILVLPAAFIGLVVARWRTWRPVRWWLPLALGVAVGLAIQIALGLGMPLGGGSGYVVNLIPTAAFAIAMMIGWLIVRNWRTRPVP